MYKEIIDPRTNEVCAIMVVDENLSFPLDPENSDYQRYLEWLAAGNKPLPADE